MTQLSFQHKVIYTIQNESALQQHCTFFENQKKQITTIDANTDASDASIIALDQDKRFLDLAVRYQLEPDTIVAFVQLLEEPSKPDNDNTNDGAASGTFFPTKQSASSPQKRQQQQLAFHPLWLYFGCTRQDLLPRFIASLSVPERVQLIVFYASHRDDDDHGDDEFDWKPLLECPGLWKGASQLDIPLYTSLCTHNLDLALALLRAHHEAPLEWSPVKHAGHWWQNVVQSVTSLTQQDKDKSTMKPTTERLSVNEFAVLLLQTHATTKQANEWTRDHVDLVFGYLPPPPPSKDFVQPSGLEHVMSLAWRHQIPIPPFLCQLQDSVDWNVLVPILVATNQLPSLPLYPHPQAILQQVVQTWTVDECVAALQENRGGLRDLLEHLALETRGCSWWSEVSVLVQARHVTLAPDPHHIQANLYRVAFLHVPFDSTLPPSLLGTLPWDRDETVAIWALDHATRYLEEDCHSRPDDEKNTPKIPDWHTVLATLPWKPHATTKLLGRVVRALRGMEESPLWECVDLNLLAENDLTMVPAQRLAVFAVVGQRRQQANLSNLLERVSTLEDRLQAMGGDVETLERERRKEHNKLVKAQNQVTRLEKETKQLEKETKQLEKDRHRLQAMEAARQKNKGDAVIS